MGVFSLECWNAGILEWWVLLKLCRESDLKRTESGKQDGTNPFLIFLTEAQRTRRRSLNFLHHEAHEDHEGFPDILVEDGTRTASCPSFLRGALDTLPRNRRVLNAGFGNVVDVVEVVWWNAGVLECWNTG